MKVDFSTKLKDFGGKPIPKSPTDQEAITLGEIAVNSLLSMTDADQKMPALEKFKLGKLAERIYGKKEVDLKSEDITLLKKRIGAIYATIVVFRAFEILDPEEMNLEK